MSIFESLYHNRLLRVIVALNLIVGVVGSALVFYIQSQQTVVAIADASVAEPLQQAEKALAALNERSTRAQAEYSEQLNAARANIAGYKVKIAQAEASVAVKQQQAAAAKADAEAKMQRLTQPLAELRTRLETEISQMQTKVDGLTTTAVCLAEVEMEWSGHRLSDLGRDPRLAPPGWRDTRHPDASRLFGDCETGFTKWLNQTRAYGALAVAKGSPAFCFAAHDMATQDEADRKVMEDCAKARRTCAIMFRLVPPFTLMTTEPKIAPEAAASPPKPVERRQPAALDVAAQTPALAPTQPAPAPVAMPIDNYDFEGGDLVESVRNVDWAGCQAQCPRTSGCVAVSYDKWNRRCYLKGRIGVGYLNPRAVSRIFNGSGWQKAPTNEQMTVFPGALVYEPKDRLWQMSGTLAACAARCSSDRECLGVVRAKETGMCDGIHLANDMIRNRSSESMAKQQIVPQ